MFLPDVILPEQLRALRSGPLQSEKRLLLAIVEDAIHCFQTYIFAHKPSDYRLFQEAEEWINTTHPHWLFSFENICEVLGLSPSHLRSALNQWKEEQLFQQNQAM